MNKLTIKLIRALVEPTAARAWGPTNCPTTMMSAALNSSCKNAGNRQGDGEPDDLPQQGAVGHVNFIGATAAFQFR